MIYGKIIILSSINKRQLCPYHQILRENTNLKATEKETALDTSLQS